MAAAILLGNSGLEVSSTEAGGSSPAPQTSSAHGTGHSHRVGGIFQSTFFIDDSSPW